MQKMQHITDKEITILNYFYTHKKGHVRQIKKATNLSEHTLIKYLKKLETKKILTSKKQGNLKIYEINPKNQLIKILFSYFDNIKIENLEYKRKKTIKEFLQKIKNIKLPYFILLFGSTAKENYTKTSDIDLIITYQDYNKTTQNKIEELTKNLYAETGLKINIILITLKELTKEKDNKENYALQDAIQTGYPIMGNTLFYEVTLK